MILDKLRIQRVPTWRAEDGKPRGYEGAATFEGKDGSVTVNLNEEQTRQILAICANSVIELSAEVARAMVAGVQVIEHDSAALEAVRHE